MVTLVIYFVLGLLCVARAELILTPNPSEYEVEGVKFKQVAFMDGDKKVTYKPPFRWQYSGSAAQLTLYPPDKTQAEAVISRVALPSPGPFDEDTMKKLVAEVTTMLPKESSEVSVVAEEKNPILISNKETFEVLLKYKLLGQLFERSILFLNRDKEQMRFQFTAREADFNQLHGDFRASLCTWQNL
jgi:hypothetical protein